MIRRLLTRLRGSQGGTTILEFGLIAPVALFMLMGFMEVTYQAYIQSVLTGAVRKAGRDAGIEGGAANWSTIDAKVLAQIQLANPQATQDKSSTHVSYAAFTGVGVAEKYTGTGSTYNPATDCFTDTNGNGVWDSDQGVSNSQGGASDVSVYTYYIKYPRLFPLTLWMKWGNTANLSATTILVNQPYATQSATSPKTCCPGSPSIVCQ